MLRCVQHAIAPASAVAYESDPGWRPISALAPVGVPQGDAAIDRNAVEQAAILVCFLCEVHMSATLPAQRYAARRDFEGADDQAHHRRVGGRLHALCS